MDIESASLLRATISRLARRLNVPATNEGLTPTEASILALTAKRGTASLSELVDLEGVNPTMLSRVVGRLQDRGLVERLPDPFDARSALVKVTTQGRATHKRIKTARAGVVSRCVEQLDAGHAAALEAALPALQALADQLQLVRA